MERQRITTGQVTGSDCMVTIETRTAGGREIILRSRVEALYGRHIRRLVNDMLYHFGINDIYMEIVDEGALDFVIAARVEAAVSLVYAELPEFILPGSAEKSGPSEKDGLRRSRLYLPGNTPKLMLNAAVHKPDGLILDLEDAVAPARKAEARYLVRNALRSLDMMGAEKMVRINQGDAGLKDLEYCIPAGAQLILLPKCESAEQVNAVDEKIRALKAAAGESDPVWIMPIIESALGVMRSFEIASASERVAAMAIGLEDYTADLGTSRTKEGQESLYARMTQVNAAKAAGIQAIDSVFSDVADMDGLRENVRVSKSLGFDGMGCIHPRQIRVIHDGYAPEPAEIEKAKAVSLAFDEAEKKGLGVVSLGTKMIDAPVVKRALRTIDLAIRTGRLSADWKEENND